MTTSLHVPCPSPFLEASTSLMDPHGDGDEAVEADPSGRFIRYAEVVEKDALQHVYKAFDEKVGVDVAWSKIWATPSMHGLFASDETTPLVQSIRRIQALSHTNIAKCYRCWKDGDCINLITELFSDGNLRRYRKRHKRVDVKAMKKWGKQILKALEFLHGCHPPVAHGALSCDNIYILGHAGHIKVGYFGLAALQLQRQADGSPSVDLYDLQHMLAGDVLSFGLCMLELLTMKSLTGLATDPAKLQALLKEVEDPTASSMIAACFMPEERRPCTSELLKHAFFMTVGPPGGQALKSRGRSVEGAGEASLSPSRSMGNLAAAGAARNGACPVSGVEGVYTSPNGSVTLSDKDEPIFARESIGKLKGEDFLFHFSGDSSGEVVHFTLVIEMRCDASSSGSGSPPLQGTKRKVSFSFDPLEDTAEAVAEEMALELGFGEVDQEICAAGLKEWLSAGTDQGSLHGSHGPG